MASLIEPIALSLLLVAGQDPPSDPPRDDTAEAVADGLEWLRAHQSPDGSWDADGFMRARGEDCGCGGAGDPHNDVGATGLALRAFLGAGSTPAEGPHRDVVSRAVRWLLEEQDPATGRIGDAVSHTFMYRHGIATLALAEAYLATRSAALRPALEKAVDYVQRARNPYGGAWRYDAPPVGDNDTSVTTWMVLALDAAAEAGLEVDPAAFTGALNWLDEVTDPSNGRVGYSSRGSTSSRVAGVNDHYPTRGEAMTGAGLLCRLVIGQQPKDAPVMRQHADLLLASLPEWDPKGLGCDMYYWYHGSQAMARFGGRHWRAWQDSMRRAMIFSQRLAGHLRGSWDPVGPWGFSGGRVYSTALIVLSLQAKAP